jgi:DNA-binding transcriptional MocR family regulator
MSMLAFHRHLLREELRARPLKLGQTLFQYLPRLSSPANQRGFFLWLTLTEPEQANAFACANCEGDFSVLPSNRFLITVITLIPFSVTNNYAP